MMETSGQVPRTVWTPARSEMISHSPLSKIWTFETVTTRVIWKKTPFIIKNRHFPAACCEKQSKIDKFWTDGYYVSTVSQHGNEETIRRYVEEKGIEEDYRQIHDDEQLKLF